jgi:hypothetical protein
VRGRFAMNSWRRSPNDGFSFLPHHHHSNYSRLPRINSLSLEHPENSTYSFRSSSLQLLSPPLSTSRHRLQHLHDCPWRRVRLSRTSKYALKHISREICDVKSRASYFCSVRRSSRWRIRGKFPSPISDRPFSST